MAARGRTPGFTMSHEHRVKIQNSNILNALIEHAQGERAMTATQVTAGLGLLKKALPDLTSVEHSGEQQHDVTIGWKFGTSKSTTSQENSSSPSTTEPSDLPVLSPTDEPVKP
jgi:hypothetical protein